MKSMTGVAGEEIAIVPFGKIFLEIRTTNHKYLETVFHLPVGFLSLEDKIKKEIEAYDNLHLGWATLTQGVEVTKIPKVAEYDC